MAPSLLETPTPVIKTSLKNVTMPRTSNKNSLVKTDKIQTKSEISDTFTKDSLNLFKNSYADVEELLQELHKEKLVSEHLKPFFKQY